MDIVLFLSVFQPSGVNELCGWSLSCFTFALVVFAHQNPFFIHLCLCDDIHFEGTPLSFTCFSSVLSRAHFALPLQFFVPDFTLQCPLSPYEI